MNINYISTKLSPEEFFGIKDAKKLKQFGMENLAKLKLAVQKEISFANLGGVPTNEISKLNSIYGARPRNLSDFQKKGLAILTLDGPEYQHSNDLNSMTTHTIGFIINKNPNEYFYKSSPQIIIMDPLGDNYPHAREIHNSLKKDFLNKAFPGSEVIITKNPQQTDGSLTCLNWTLANLKIAQENRGRTDILNLLPKSSDQEKILKEQMQYLQSNPVDIY